MLSEPPDSAPSGGLSERACRLLAGLEVGLGGALILTLWFAFQAWLRGQFWWSRFNILGSLFYGDRVYYMGTGRATLAGLAILLVFYALLGALFALLARTRGFGFNLVLALTLGLAWHWLAEHSLWTRLDPAYFPILVTLPGHVIYSISLTRFAHRFTALALALGDPSWADEYLPRPECEQLPPPPDDDEASPELPAALPPVSYDSSEPAPEALQEPSPASSGTSSTDPPPSTPDSPSSTSPGGIVE